MIERPPTEAIASAPWYRNRWFWLVAAPPIAAVIGGVLTVVIAVRNADSLVVDDYAHIGRTFDLDQSRDQRARALGVTALLRIDAPTGATELTIRGVPMLPIELKLIHPTNAAGDRQIRLTPGADGRYVGNLGQLEAMHHYVEIASPDQGWRLRGELPASAGELQVAPR